MNVILMNLVVTGSPETCERESESGSVGEVVRKK